MPVFGRNPHRIARPDVEPDQHGLVEPRRFRWKSRWRWSAPPALLLAVPARPGVRRAVQGGGRLRRSDGSRRPTTPPVCQAGRDARAQRETAPLDRGGVARVSNTPPRPLTTPRALGADAGLADCCARPTTGPTGRSALAQAAHVQRAIDAKERRADPSGDACARRSARRAADRHRGAGTGQGLSVVELRRSLRRAHRMTARGRLGGGGVIDIERESELGGAIRSKGVLILSGFLSSRYAQNKPPRGERQPRFRAVIRRG